MQKLWIVLLGFVFLITGIFPSIRAESGYQIIGKGVSPESMVHPAGVAFHYHFMYVCDTIQSKILIYDTRSKKLVNSFGAYGNTSIHLKEPQGICIDNLGNIYITQLDQVVKFDDQLRYVASFDIPGILLDILYHDDLIWICHYSANEIIVVNPKTMQLSHRFSTGLGPVSLDFNSSNEVIVSEVGEHRISFYDEKGKRLRNPLILGKSSIIDGVSVGLNDWIFLHDSFYYQIHAYSKGGGSKLREIDIPGKTVRCWKPGLNGMVVRNDLIFFSSVSTQEIIVYNDMGTPRETYGKKASDDELLYPKALAIASDEVHLADLYAGNVKRYTHQGKYVGTYGSQPGRGRMDYPSGIALHNQEVFILNAHSSIYVFDTKGIFQREINVQTPLNCATDLAVFRSAIYLADAGNRRVIKLDTSGKLIQQWNSFVYPSSIYLDQNERLFVADSIDASIKIFNQGDLWQTLRHPKMKEPAGMILTEKGILLVSDKAQHEIHIFLYNQQQFEYIKSFGSFGGPKSKHPSPGLNPPDYKDDPGFFAFPEDLAYDGTFIYVVDRLNQRVQRIASGFLLEGLVPEENDIDVYPLKLDFGRIIKGESSNLELSLRKTGPKDIEGSIEANQEWIRLSKMKFQGDTDIRVSVNSDDLSPGEHISEIIVNSNFRKIVIPVTVYIDSEETPPDEPPPPKETKRIEISLQINNPKAVINQKEVWIDESNHAVVPVILPPGRTFVPIRFISESFGAEVQWDGNTRTVRIFLEALDVRITLQIDNKIARINQDIVNLDAPPQILNGRTFVPLRFIAEAFGAEVQWNGAEQRITILLEV